MDFRRIPVRQTYIFIGVKGNDKEKLKNSLWLKEGLTWKKESGNHIVKIE